MLILKRRQKEVNLYDKRVENLISTFIEKKEEIDKLTKELNSIKEDIVKVANEQRDSEKSIQLLLSNCGVKVTFSDELKIIDSKKLQNVLGDEFYLFVKEEFKAKLGLRTLFENKREVSECLELNEKKPLVTLIRV